MYLPQDNPRRGVLLTSWASAGRILPKMPIPLAAHHTYHSAAMNCDVGYSIFLPPNYAADAARYPVVYWLPGGGLDETPDDPTLLTAMDVAIGRESSHR